MARAACAGDVDLGRHFGPVQKVGLGGGARESGCAHERRRTDRYRQPHPEASAGPTLRGLGLRFLFRLGLGLGSVVALGDLALRARVLGARRFGVRVLEDLGLLDGGFLGHST